MTSPGPSDREPPLRGADSEFPIGTDLCYPCHGSSRHGTPGIVHRGRSVTADCHLWRERPVRRWIRLHPSEVCGRKQGAAPRTALSALSAYCVAAVEPSSITRLGQSMW